MYLYVRIHIYVSTPKTDYGYLHKLQPTRLVNAYHIHINFRGKYCIFSELHKFSIFTILFLKLDSEINHVRINKLKVKFFSLLLAIW